jgi:hypothetical protein
VGGVVAHAGHVLDDQRDALQRPQLAGKSAGDRVTLQRLLDLGERLVGQAWGGAGRPFAAQRTRSASAPAAMPGAHRLAGDAELAGDLGLEDASGNSSAARSRRCSSWSRWC